MGGGAKIKKYSETKNDYIFILFYQIKKISLSINLKKFLAEFWRPPPGGARGQLPPPAPPRYATVEGYLYMCTTSSKQNLHKLTLVVRIGKGTV